MTLVNKIQQTPTFGFLRQPQHDNQKLGFPGLEPNADGSRLTAATFSSSKLNVLA